MSEHPENIPKRPKTTTKEKSIRDDDLFSWTNNLVSESDALAVYEELLNIDKQLQKEYNIVNGRNRVDNHVDIYADRDIDNAVAISGEYDDSLPALMAAIASPEVRAVKIPTNPTNIPASQSTTTQAHISQTSANTTSEPTQKKQSKSSSSNDYGHAIVDDDDEHEEESISYTLPSQNASIANEVSSVHPAAQTQHTSSSNTETSTNTATSTDAQPSDFFQSLSQAVAQALSVSPDTDRSVTVLAVEKAAKDKMKHAFRAERGLTADIVTQGQSNERKRARNSVEEGRYGDVSEKDVIPDMEWEFLIQKIGSAPPRDATDASTDSDNAKEGLVQESIAKLIRDTRMRMISRAEQSKKQRERARTSHQKEMQEKSKQTAAVRQILDDEGESEVEEDDEPTEAFINTEEEQFQHTLSSISYTVLQEHVRSLLEAASTEYTSRVAAREQRAKEELRTRSERIKRRQELLVGATAMEDEDMSADEASAHEASGEVVETKTQNDDDDNDDGDDDAGLLPVSMDRKGGNDSVEASAAGTTEAAAAAAPKPYVIDYTRRDLFAMLRGEVDAVDEDDAWLMGRLKEELVPAVFDEEDLKMGKWGLEFSGKGTGRKVSPFYDGDFSKVQETSVDTVHTSTTTLDDNRENSQEKPEFPFIIDSTSDDQPASDMAMDSIEAMMMAPFEGVYSSMQHAVQMRKAREQENREKELLRGKNPKNPKEEGDEEDVRAEMRDKLVETSFFSAGLGAFAMKSDAEERLVHWLQDLSVEGDFPTEKARDPLAAMMSDSLAMSGLVFKQKASNAFNGDHAMNLMNTMDQSSLSFNQTGNNQENVPVWLLSPSQISQNLAAAVHAAPVAINSAHTNGHVNPAQSGEATSLVSASEGAVDAKSEMHDCASTNADESVPSADLLSRELSLLEEAELRRIGMLDMMIAQAEDVNFADDSSDDEYEIEEEEANMIYDDIPALMPLDDNNADNMYNQADNLEEQHNVRDIASPRSIYASSDTDAVPAPATTAPAPMNNQGPATQKQRASSLKTTNFENLGAAFAAKQALFREAEMHARTSEQLDLDYQPNWDMMPLDAAMNESPVDASGVAGVLSDSHAGHNHSRNNHSGNNGVNSRAIVQEIDEFDFPVDSDSDFDDFDGEDDTDFNLGLGGLVRPVLTGNQEDDVRAQVLSRLLGIEDIQQTENRLARVYGVSLDDSKSSSASNGHGASNGRGVAREMGEAGEE